MKTIGLIGGMSWESSLEYYRIINETVKERLGGLHSAQCLLYSFDFQPIEELQHAENWDRLTELMIEAAKNLEFEDAARYRDEIKSLEGKELEMMEGAGD